jgi:hypothetical protein
MGGNRGAALEVAKVSPRVHPPVMKRGGLATAPVATMVEITPGEAMIGQQSIVNVCVAANVKKGLESGSNANFEARPAVGLPFVVMGALLAAVASPA